MRQRKKTISKKKYFSKHYCGTTGNFYEPGCIHLMRYSAELCDKNFSNIAYIISKKKNRKMTETIFLNF